MGPEQGPGEEELGVSQETSQEKSTELAVGQRVSFVEGESMMGEGKQVEKFGTIVDIKTDTVGVQLEGMGEGSDDVKEIVRVGKNEIRDASER